MSDSASRPPLRLVSLGCALLLAACGDTSSEPPTGDPPPPPPGVGLAIVSGNEQVAPTDSLLPAPLVVRVTDDRDQPVPGIRIRWTQHEARGFMGPTVPVTLTDSKGLASLSRRLGYYAGLYTTIAMIDGDTSKAVQFRAYGHIQNATQMRSVDGGNFVITDTVFATPAPHRVLVLDHLDRPVPGVVVTWTASMGGSLSAPTSTTDTAGIAQVSYALGPRAGNYAVHAHVEGLGASPVTFPIDALPGKLAAVSATAGTGQTALVRARARPYAVSAADAHGNGHTGVTVAWSIVSGGGSIDRTTSVTTRMLVDGELRSVATATHTLGPDEVPQVVTATLPDHPAIAPITFSTVPVTAVVSIGGVDDYYCWYWGYCTWSFTPSQSEVPAGRSVLWAWGGNDPHHIVFEDEPTTPPGPGPQTVGMRVRRFTSAGTVRYRCTVHSTSFTEGMVGSVTVK